MPAVEKPALPTFAPHRRQAGHAVRGRFPCPSLPGVVCRTGHENLSAGYEFGHRDDYEGRRVLPDIKVDADSRNIEELEITPTRSASIQGKAKTPRKRPTLEAKGLVMFGSTTA
jgi:hypothetical protein